MRNYNYASELGGSSQVLEKTWDTCYMDEPACPREVSRPPPASDINHKLILIQINKLPSTNFYFP